MPALRPKQTLDSAPRWPLGGGECGALIRDHDWSATPLGPVADWSGALRTTVANIVNSPVPKVLMWGPDNVLIYNDAYTAIAGDKHPAALGGTAEGVWPEIWDWNRSILDRSATGEVVAYRDQPMTLLRDGVPQTFFFDLFYTPVYLDDGTVGGAMCTVIDNTARVSAEVAVAHSVAELRTITDALPVLISYLDRDLVYRFANGAYQQWFGRTPDQMVGCHLREVLGEESYAERLPLVERALAGEPIASEGRLPHRDGSFHRADIRYIPRIGDDGDVLGIHILVTDVEERAQREAAVRRSNDRFRGAMEAVHGVLWTNSRDGQMTGEQPGWAALTGQAREDYAGYGWANAVHPEDSDATVAAWNAAVAAKSVFVFEHRVRRHDGAWRNCLIRAQPITDADGEIVEWVGVHTDITEQRAAEQSLRDQAEHLQRQVRHRERAEEQLRHLNEHLEARVISEIGERRRAEAALAQAQKMETIGKLTGGVAHDFNNLLTPIVGALDLLQRKGLGGEREKRLIDGAALSAERARTLVQRLLAFARRQPLQAVAVDVAALVRGMIDLVASTIGPQIRVLVEAPHDLPTATADPNQLEMALLNLVVNARDAMPDGGTLRIAAMPETIVQDGDLAPGRYICLSVTDTGTGMSAETMARAVEPFFSTKGVGKGTGLGLSMVHGLASQLGGALRLRSTAGEGTCVELWLPQGQAVAPLVSAAVPPVLEASRGTALLVDDEEFVRLSTAAMLGELGYDVVEADSAEAALALIDAGMAPDLVVTDHLMPGMTGSDFARRLLRGDPALPVLVISGYAESEGIAPDLPRLTKPFRRDELLRSLVALSRG